MPLMNGKDLLERLKGDPKLSRIPVVMLTSDEDVEAEVALIKGGAEAFLAKSKDPRILSAQIRKLSRSPLWQEAA
jgi:DNA-binding response OmpR family regulator